MKYSVFLLFSFNSATCFFSTTLSPLIVKRSIQQRIFPIALPSKVDNVERVFNGYKKKYVDKVLREFNMI